MKGWLKALIWLGLGGGLGFFGGIQVGRRMGRKEKEEDIPEVQSVTKEEVEQAMAVYRGEISEETEDLPEETKEWVKTECDPDYERYPQRDELLRKPPFIRQLHAQDMVGTSISEEEFNQNEDEYEVKTLLFYALDEVVYDEQKGEVITNPETLLSPGWDHGFGGDPNNPNETLYFKNDTMGFYYRVDYIDAAWCDVYAAHGPEEGDCLEDDIDEEDDF